MYFLYNIVVHIVIFSLSIIGLFSDKIKLFVKGRKGIFEFLDRHICKEDRIIWFHTASLGEFEQGLPVIEQCKMDFPDYKILVTFFSPSGYEVKKNTQAADVICYLPMDTTSNMKRFLEIIQPELAVFVKYEFWPNTLRLLQQKKIPTLLISGIFRKQQAFFHSYGAFMRKSLNAFDHFFVQNQPSKELLESIGYENVTVSGDTRFDRVVEIVERNNRLDFMDVFKGNSRCVVAGSTWPEDERILVDYINNHSQSKNNVKFVIAPHMIHNAQIMRLKNSISKKVVCYSDMDINTLGGIEVLIVDTVGLLTKIYSYADIAYVGGGMGTSGLHNTLEPAVFGIPVLIGKHYQGFFEAEELVEIGGVISISEKDVFSSSLNYLLDNQNVLIEKGTVNRGYIEKKKGSKIQIALYIRKLLKDSLAN